MRKNIFNLLLLIIIIKMYSNKSINTQKQDKKIRKNNTHQVRKTIRKQYQINSSKPINPKDLNIHLDIG